MTQKLNSNRHWLGGVVILIIIAVVVIGYSTWQNQQREAAIQRRETASEISKQYFSLHRDSSWWLALPPQAPDKILIEIASLKEKQIATIINRFADVSPATNSIAKMFPHFRVSYSTGNSSIQMMMDDPKIPDQPEGFEICFYARQEQNQYPASLYYRREWQAVMIAAISWPDKVLPAMLYHELGHALSDRKNRPSANATDDSDSWIGEEVEMHTVEADVLNAACAGQYYAQLDAILKRSEANSPEEAVFKLTIDDLTALDQLLGCEKGGPELASVLLAEHWLILGFRYIDRTVPKDERQEAKIALYRTLRQPL